MQTVRDFVLIVTEGNADDSLIREYSEDPVMYKLPYVPPYGEFDLKGIQLAVRSKDIFQQSTVDLMIDLTDWSGHEKEEYFVTTLKFLYDHKDVWKYVFVMNEKSQNKARNMFIASRMYMQGDLVFQEKWNDEITLAQYIRKKYSLRKDVADAFAKLMYQGEFNEYQCDLFIGKAIEEISDSCENTDITIEAFKKYTTGDSSIFSIIDPDTVKAFFDNEKGKDI